VQLQKPTTCKLLPLTENHDRMNVTCVNGDLLDQDVEVIVNAWNRNIIPWWLLIPQGVSGAIKKRGGRQPFRELGRMGRIPLGHAVETSAGTLPFKSIIHVAGINIFWRSSERSIRDSVRNAITLATQRGYRSIAIPLIGAGSGGGKPNLIQSIIENELANCHFDGEVRIVRYTKTPTNKAVNGSRR
jgi:O-acetyl-ADP-ribose deacetylase